MSNSEIISLASTFGMFLVTCYIAFAKRSQRREVAMDPGVATKEEFDKFTAHNEIEHSKLWAKMDADRSSFEMSASARSAGIYRKIDEVRKETKDDLTTQTRILTEQINSVPSQVITILKNTGAI